jgi:hypothetical protein
MTCLVLLVSYILTIFSSFLLFTVELQITMVTMDTTGCILIVSVYVRDGVCLNDDQP